MNFNKTLTFAELSPKIVYNVFGINYFSTFTITPYLNRYMPPSSESFALTNDQEKYLDHANFLLYFTLIEIFMITLSFITCLSYLLVVQT